MLVTSNWWRSVDVGENFSQKSTLWKFQKHLPYWSAVESQILICFLDWATADGPWLYPWFFAVVRGQLDWLKSKNQLKMFQKCFILEKGKNNVNLTERQHYSQILEIRNLISQWIERLKVNDNLWIS